ncbi:MAG TPA: hypothetical protein VLR26_17785 [Frankiaceae bacterium]|nr:hypothetical protein [Frankiaceae bacterium]
MKTEGTPLQALVDLDRRWVPRVAAELDRALVKAGGRLPGRVPLGVTERRILGILAFVLVGCAVALLLIGS